MELSKFKRIAFALMVGAGAYFATKVGFQERHAEEYMNLSKSCAANVNTSCELLENNGAMLLALWDGNLSYYITISLLCFMLAGFFANQLGNKSKSEGL